MGRWGGGSSPPFCLQTLLGAGQGGGGVSSPKLSEKIPRNLGHCGLSLFSTAPQPQLVKTPKSVVSCSIDTLSC